MDNYLHTPIVNDTFPCASCAREAPYITVTDINDGKIAHMECLCCGNGMW